MNEPYNSRQDTLDHIERVRDLLDICRLKLHERAMAHDQSKLQYPEKEAFDRLTPKLKGLTYGSDEYVACLVELGEALNHHYEHNSHHPEHFKKEVCIICFQEFREDPPTTCPNCHNGCFTSEPDVSQMTLFDVIEMLCDWKAATERHADGSIAKSLEINKDRFKINDQLASILENTAREMEWI